MESLVHKILLLLGNFQEHKITVQTFCSAYEDIWNFEITPKNVPEAIYPILSRLFDEVVYYSPFPKNQWDYPCYRTEEEIRHAVTQALGIVAHVDAGR